MRRLYVKLISLAGGALVASLIAGAGGCSKDPAGAPKAHLRPEVKAVKVEKRTIARWTGQPGFIEAYEQTAIYPKIAGFIDAWKVDIGDRITKDMEMAHLDIPDLVAENDEKKAAVELDEVLIRVARDSANVAEQNWKTAQAQVKEAEAILGKFKADVDYWTADYKRIHALYLMKAVEQPVDDTSYKHMQATIAGLHSAESGVDVAKATAAARKADFDKSQTDIAAAQARTKVARATEKRLAAMVGYTTIRAPYDGIVVKRNVNVGDFAQPATGDPSAQRNNPAALRASSNPLYVVARTDKVRIYLDVPGMDANGVHVGSKAHVTIQALDNIEFPAAVTRTSWALNAKSRTLRAEIDTDNPGGQIRPNMYAYGRVELTRTNVWAIPQAALIQLGNQDCCYALEDGKAVRLPVELGIGDGTWVEVTKKRIKAEWTPFDGTERILVGELSQLSDGAPVRVEAPAAKSPVPAKE